MKPELTALIERLNDAIAAMDYAAWTKAWYESTLGPLDEAHAAVACDPFLATDRDFRERIVWETRGRAHALLDINSRQLNLFGEDERGV